MPKRREIKRTFQPKLRPHQLRYAARFSAFAAVVLLLVSGFLFIAFLMQFENPSVAGIFLGGFFAAALAAVVAGSFAGMGVCLENMEARLAQIQEILQNQQET